MAGDVARSHSGSPKAVLKAEAARKKAALVCAAKLAAASEALNAYLRACNECDDESRGRGLDDSRLILMRNINEYSNYLSAVYDK